MDRSCIRRVSQIEAVDDDSGKEVIFSGQKILSELGKRVLDEENFRSHDFWEGYKLYCFAHYSQCTTSRRQFIASKMCRVVNLIKKQKHVRWGSMFDESVRHVWAMMEEYAVVCHGQDWKNLRALMEQFDDVKKLSTSENGCLLLQLVEDDDRVSQTLHRQFEAVELQCTDIFDELQGRLKRIGSNLDNLMKCSTSSGKVGIRKKARRRRRGSPVYIDLGET